MFLMVDPTDPVLLDGAMWIPLRGLRIGMLFGLSYGRAYGALRFLVATISITKIVRLESFGRCLFHGPRHFFLFHAFADYSLLGAMLAVWRLSLVVRKLRYVAILD